MNPSFLIFFILISCNINNDGKVVDQKEATLKNLNSDTVSLLPFDSIKLSEHSTTLIVSFAAIECTCPQWFESKFKDIDYLEGVERFYLEPKQSGFLNANDLWDGKNLPLTVQVFGKFSINKELPKRYSSKSIPEKARIFVYDSIVVIEPSKFKPN